MTRSGFAIRQAVFMAGQFARNVEQNPVRKDTAKLDRFAVARSGYNSKPQGVAGNAVLPPYFEGSL
jgi:hypothetical protein